MARRQTPTRLSAPFLRRITLLPDKITEQRTYPFDLPWPTRAKARPDRVKKG